MSIEGYLTTESPGGTHTVIQGAFAAGSQVTLELQMGNNVGPAASDPKYSREFQIGSFRPQIIAGEKVMFTLTPLPMLMIIFLQQYCVRRISMSDLKRQW